VLAWTVRPAAALLFLGMAWGIPDAGAAQTAGASRVTGTVTSADGRPIAGASIALTGNGPARIAVSDKNGRFHLATVPAGTYVVQASASGYSTLSGRTVAVAPNAETSLSLVLPAAQVSSFTVIGTVTTNGSTALSTAPAPSLEISSQPYAQQGVTRVSDILQYQLSTTVIPIIGGGLNAPAAVALRGPDPSETLVAVDGHQVNNGSTGDFDLSLLDPADLQSLQVVYGIAPSSLFGPNTLGGALNVLTLEPTAQPHTLLRFSGGSYDTFGTTLDTTGTANRLGYAFSYHRVTSGGQLSDYQIPTNDSTGTAPVSNAMDATSLLGKLRYSFGSGNGFIGLTFHEQSVYRDLSATLSSVQTPVDGAPGPGSAYDNFAGSSSAANNVAYGLDAQIPLGHQDSDGTTATTLIFRHQTAFANQSVFGPGAGTSPYLYNDRDLIADDTLEVDHVLPHGLLSIKGSLTDESLTTDFIPGVVFAESGVRSPLSVTPLDAITGIPDSSQQQLGQTQRWLGLSYSDDPTSKLHYTFAGYYSNYSSFGTAFDPRVGFVWTPTADSALRISAGNTFQSPQLPTFIVPPVLPAPVDGYVSIGNPNATAERATAFDVGYEQLFRLPQYFHVALDLYRTNLHNGVATYFSPGSAAYPCPEQSGIDYTNHACLSYPVNVTHEVYQGLEVRGDLALRPHTSLHASFDIDSVYTESYPSTAADDTPLFEQALGVPLHKIGLTFEHDKPYGMSYYVGLLYEGTYNELNLPPFATLRAGVTYRIHGFDVGLYGTNLTNANNFPLTRLSAGVPYGTLTSGLQPTDAIPLAGPQLTFSISRHT